jgi:hypothetical protein
VKEVGDVVRGSSGDWELCDGQRAFVCGRVSGSVRKGHTNRVRGWAQVGTGMVDSQEVASRSGVDDRFCGEGWGSIGGEKCCFITTTIERVRVGIKSRANRCIIFFNRPKESLGLSNLAAAHSVGASCFLLVAAGRILASFTRVLVSNMEPVSPTIVAVVPTVSVGIGAVVVGLQGLDGGLQLAVLSGELVDFGGQSGELVRQRLQNGSAGGVSCC